MSNWWNRKGIKNLKNTCFMNSVFQLLTAVPEVRDYFHTKQFSESSKDSWLCLFQSFINCYGFDITPIDPKPLVKESFSLFPGSKPHTQQDAQEFFYLLIDKLDTELHKTGEPKIFENLFQGEILTTINCCLEKKQYKEEFLQLNLSIQNIEDQIKAERTDEEIELLLKTQKSFCCRSIPNENLTIKDCLRQYFSNFQEAPQDSCLVCGQSKSCSKKTDLAKHPNNLIICLKRFTYTKKFSKLSTKVFALENISLHASAYELISVIQHSSFLGRRHYKVYCKDGGVWLECNDTRITPTSFAKVQKAQPYILVYKLLNTAEPRPENQTREAPQSYSSIGSKISSCKNSIIPDSFVADALLGGLYKHSQSFASVQVISPKTHLLNSQLLKKSETVCENTKKKSKKISIASQGSAENFSILHNPTYSLPEVNPELLQKSQNTTYRDSQSRQISISSITFDPSIHPPKPFNSIAPINSLLTPPNPPTQLSPNHLLIKP